MIPIKFVVPSFLFTQLISAFLRNDGNPGLATAAGSILSLLTMMTHFLGKKNTLYLVKTQKLFEKLKTITVTGFSTFFIDVAMGILTVLFNRQILSFLGTDALSVYGIISANYGAKKGARIRQTLRYALYTAAAFGLFWTCLSLAVPNLYVRIFMMPTDKILSMAPAIIRSYGISFLLLPFNIFPPIIFRR
jgi:Na+-driven multidrug efflux pump